MARPADPTPAVSCAVYSGLSVTPNTHIRYDSCPGCCVLSHETVSQVWPQKNIWESQVYQTHGPQRWSHRCKGHREAQEWKQGRGRPRRPFSVPGARELWGCPQLSDPWTWVTKGRGNVGIVCGVDKEVGWGLEAKFLKMPTSQIQKTCKTQPIQPEHQIMTLHGNRVTQME